MKDNEAIKETSNKSKLWIIIVVVLVALVLAGVLIWMSANQNSGEKVFKDYMEAMIKGDTDKIMELTDLKATNAWINAGKDASKFKEEYDKIKDEEVKDLEDDYKKSLTSTLSFANGQIDVNVISVEKTEDLGSDLKKYKGKIKVKMLDIENETEMTMVIYKDKYVVDLNS